MSTINQLPVLSSVSSGDQFVMFATSQGDTRRVPVSTLLAYFERNFASPDVAATLYTPGTGFTIGLYGTSNLWALLQPATTLATGSITLPLNSGVPDGQEVTVTTTQQITAFSLLPNGATAVFGAPTTLGADDWFKVRFYSGTNSWYRVG